MTKKHERRELINHPQHYGGDVPHEVWKCLNAWGLEMDALLWNAVKYIARAGKKDSTIEDLKKAQWYLNKRIELIERRSIDGHARSAVKQASVRSVKRAPRKRG